MSLIEQLGGYENTKKFINGECSDGFDVQGLRDALLEYRREHNIFETGDWVVLEKWHDDNVLLSIYRVFSETECKTIKAVKRDSGVSRYGHKKNFRHATPYEIHTGKRCSHPLNSKRSDGTCGLCKLSVHERIEK